MSPRKKAVAIYAAILSYMAAPLLSALIASSIASATGSTLDEGDSHPCIVLGHDVGGILYSMFVSFWFALLTIPTGGLALIAFTVWLLVKRKTEPNRVAGGN